MELTELIRHPETMDKETLYELRALLALHPYYQAARMLLLQNLYILHDPTFDEELRKAAIYITDRNKIFQLVEARHYQLQHTENKPEPLAEGNTENRTLSLIDNFLDSLPEDNQPATTNRRKPTPADAAVDYVAYLLETEEQENTSGAINEPQMKGQSLIDNFISNSGGKIELKNEPEYLPPEEELLDEENATDETFFTETLARIYIKQGRYSKALEIIKRLNLIYPKKSAYFADQIRFLEKLILNNK